MTDSRHLNYRTESELCRKMKPLNQYQLIQVLPRFLPGNCGVTDHAIELAHELKSAFGISTAFVVPTSRVAADVSEAVTRTEPNRLVETCLSLIGGEAGALLVHVSGYGYSPDGAPVLLANALGEARTTGRFRIAAYFHELFASGPPWRSAFWYSRRQKKAIRKIQEECDSILTNTQSHARWLESAPSRRSAASVQILPVFSTVGEASTSIPFSSRTRAMVVFGLPGTRERSYNQLSKLTETIQRLAVTEILDIGPDCAVPSAVAGAPVRRMGKLPASELAPVISQSAFGFVHYSPRCVAKSSVFASYCAYGTIPVLAQPPVGEVDGLRDGCQVLSPASVADIQYVELEVCSTAALHWYGSHRVHTHAEAYAKWLSH